MVTVKRRFPTPLVWLAVAVITVVTFLGRLGRRPKYMDKTEL